MSVIFDDKSSQFDDKSTQFRVFKQISNRVSKEFDENNQSDEKQAEDEKNNALNNIRPAFQSIG